MLEAIGLTFGINLAVGSFATLTVPSLVIPFSGLLMTGLRAAAFRFLRPSPEEAARDDEFLSRRTQADEATLPCAGETPPLQPLPKPQWLIVCRIVGDDIYYQPSVGGAGTVIHEEDVPRGTEGWEKAAGLLRGKHWREGGS